MARFPSRGVRDTVGFGDEAYGYQAWHAAKKSAPVCGGGQVALVLSVTRAYLAAIGGGAEGAGI